MRAAWLLAFAVPFLLFIASTYPASRYLVPLVPFVALFAAAACDVIRKQGELLAIALCSFACAWGFDESRVTDSFIRHTDTRTLALEFVESHIPGDTTILTQPYSVPLEPSADVAAEAVQRSGQAMPTKTRLQIERSPYPSPAYRLIYLGFGLDADKLYLPVEQLSADPLGALRREHVAFVVLKRYNDGDPATLPFLSALAREGPAYSRVFTVPERRGAGQRPAGRAFPAQH